MSKLNILSYRIPAVIFLLSICSALFSDLYVPSLPIIASYFNCSINLSQATITSFLLGFSIGQFIYGPLSDRCGRRKIVLAALLIACAASILCAISYSIHMLLIGRFCQGIGVAACLSLSRAIMRDVYQGKEMAKINSLVSACVELIITFSPAIGGYLAYYYGWRGNFYFLFVFVFLSLLIVYRQLPETNKELNVDAINIRRIKINYYRLLTDKKFLGYAFCSSVAYSLLMIYFSISPFILQNHLHFTVSEYGLISLLTSVMLVAGAFSNSYFVHKLDINWMILVGIICLILAGIFMLIGVWCWGTNIYLVIIPSMLSILGASFLFSNCSAGALHKFPDIAGTASSVFSGLQITGAFVVTYYISLSGFKTAIALAGIYLALGLIAYFSYYSFISQLSIKKVNFLNRLFFSKI